jgi:hypothetical protein
MANMLRDLLDAKEPLFSLSLRQLEKASGNRGVDTKLIGDIIEKTHAATAALGLDSKDTTGRELYHALLAKVQAHDRHLARAVGGRETDDAEALLPLIKLAVEHTKVPKSCWALKRSVAKDMLRKTPPPTVMKLMGHRSVESMLKHEHLAEIYGALRFAESTDWLSKFNEQYEALKPSDFETREIEFVIMPRGRWADAVEGFVKRKRHNVTHLKELGIVLMLPVKSRKRSGVAITVIPLLFHYINEIRLYSAFFKLQQVKKSFGKILVKTLNADSAHAAVMAGSNIHWRIIQRYFGRMENEYHPEIFEPHVQPEDLYWHKAEDALCLLDPELGFWQGLDYVARREGDRPISFNLIDVAVSYTTNVPYESRVIYNFRESLWIEIFIRYMGQKTFEQQVLQQLNSGMIAPEAKLVGLP